MNNPSTSKGIVLITGGLGGIGFATAKLFARNGYEVVIFDKVEKKQAPELPSGVEYYSCDVRNVQEIKNLFRFLKKRYGRLDVLVTAHGIHSTAKCLEASEEDFDEVMGTNFKSVFFLCSEALRLMNEGVIINIGSSVGIAADKDAPIYSVSKAAVHHLTKCLAQKYGRRVRINALALGPVDTPLLQDAFNNDAKIIDTYRASSLRGIATPEEVARFIYFMASDECKFMNGAIVPFDGGESILYSGEPPK